LPFGYFLALYARYDSLFAGIRIDTEKNASLKWYARTEILQKCNVSLKKLSKLTMGDLMHITNEKEVDALLESKLTETPK
jgi:hypothetical protein